MAAAARERGVRFIDAPVSGTKDPAEKGELLIYAGGDKQDVEEVRPLLEVLGRKVLYTGENGMATSMKMVVNLMLGESMLAFAEALLLGEALGLSQEMLFETLVGGPVTAPFLGLKVDKIKTGDYEADFPLQWLVKDLHLATLSGYEQEVPLPAASAAQQIFALAKQKGFAGEDFSAIYAFLKENGAK
jgi:3-hydroxyisobutyrate dehydrogenase/glyoxylate/succinic semialdehyde reductase